MAPEREPPPSQLRLLDVPQVPVNFVPAAAGERFKLGTMTIRIMEDGSRTGESFVLFLAFPHGSLIRSLSSDMR